MAFEADHIDPIAESGWSVLVRGTATHLLDADRISALADTAVHPWAPGRRDRWIEIHAQQITGRIIWRQRLVSESERRRTCRPAESGILEDRPAAFSRVSNGWVLRATVAENRRLRRHQRGRIFGVTLVALLTMSSRHAVRSQRARRSRRTKSSSLSAPPSGEWAGGRVPGEQQRQPNGDHGRSPGHPDRHIRCPPAHRNSGVSPSGGIPPQRSADRRGDDRCCGGS